MLLYFGIFVWDFLWQGGFILLPLHLSMVWDHANGAGIPGTDQSALIGGDGEFQINCRAEGPRT